MLAASIAVIVVTFLLRPGADHATDGTGVPESVRGAATPSETASAEPSAKASAKPSDDAKDAAAQNGFAVAPPSLGMPGGLRGDGGSISLPKHHLTIRWRSGNPLGLIAYIIPTSRDHNEGSHIERTRRELTISTTVYGRPDYAIAYVQAGGTGEPATCEIYVDGRRTARRTTEGPYGAVWCQG